MEVWNSVRPKQYFYLNTEKKITETEITEPKSYRTKLLTNSMFLKRNFVWKHVENDSEYLIDQIGSKISKSNIFPCFSKIKEKFFFQKLSNFEYIYGVFWKDFFGFFRYTETVFRRNYRNTPKLSFGWITELNRNFGRTLVWNTMR